MYYSYIGNGDVADVETEKQMTYRILTIDVDVNVPEESFKTLDAACAEMDRVASGGDLNQDILYILDEATGIEHRWTAVDENGDGAEYYTTRAAEGGFEAVERKVAEHNATAANRFTRILNGAIADVKRRQEGQA